MNAGEPKSRLLPRWGHQPWSNARGLARAAARRPFARPRLADLTVAAGLFSLFYIVFALATASPARAPAAAISLHYAMLPLYAGYSVARMAAAYVLSLAFSLVYGYLAASNRRAERILVPVLDILQSVPILSFLPSVVLALIALFPHGRFGVEVAAVVLVFTSQAWNMTFSFYNSLLTVPRELREVARMYRLSWWQRLRQLELPFAAVGLIWNSMMSWAGGWFFLMAAEMFTLGGRSFQLPGLGSYLQAAANRGDGRAEAAGLLTLVLVIAALDQLLWRPLIAWSDRFKMETVGGRAAPRSAVLRLLRRSELVEWLGVAVLAPLFDRLDGLMSRPPAAAHAERHRGAGPRRSASFAAWAAFAVLGAWALWQAVHMLAHLPARQAEMLPGATAMSLVHVTAALLLSAAWTVPVGVLIGSNRAWSERLQPVVQILASVPATALFPVIVTWLLAVGGGLSYICILLMMLGTQWYILFNVIAGAMSIPQDLKEVTALFGITGWARWRTLVLPGIFPFLITGLVTASGGAWNAAIVTEFVQAGRHTVSTLGLGALIAQSSQHGEYALLLGSTLCLSLVVVLINRFFWRRLYRLAETRFTALS